MQKLPVDTIKTKPFKDQLPGTSGLRKSTRTFMQENYTENFVVSTLISANCAGKTLVLGGDGRFYSKEACSLIIQLAAGFGVSKIIVGQNGILSTPAVSALIRRHRTNGGIILTASHNPGGIDADFGIKFNSDNGGPAPGDLTQKIFEQTLKLSEYRVCRSLQVDLSTVTSSQFTTDLGNFAVDVVNSVEVYAELMQEVFDFNAIRAFIDSGKGFKIAVNSMNGVMGPYVQDILVGRLGVPATALYGCTPLEDFGGRHPDPNLTYAKDLVDLMASPAGAHYDMGVAFDGDGDRNMILGGGGFFVSPCDSLAVIADQMSSIKYFTEHKVNGVARSMPTAAAVDRVAIRHKIAMYVVPTGWKYFGSLMDAGKLSLCGEESFGTGSEHIREKDGLWTVLAWLSILAANKIGVETTVKKHWESYGRNFFTRYDYENVTSESADQMMKVLVNLIGSDSKIRGKKYNSDTEVVDIYNFAYKDPVTGYEVTNQGIVIEFKDGSRIIFRKSGTGTNGATIRMYIDQYVKDVSSIYKDAQEILKPLIEIGLEISQLPDLTGRKTPDVIT